MATMARPLGEATDPGKRAVYDRLDERFKKGLEIRTVTELAGELGLTKQAVSGWTRIPPCYCVPIQDLIGVRVYVQRPDVFRAPVPRKPKRGTRNGKRRK